MYLLLEVELLSLRACFALYLVGESLVSRSSRQRHEVSNINLTMQRLWSHNSNYYEFRHQKKTGVAKFHLLKK